MISRFPIFFAIVAYLVDCLVEGFFWLFGFGLVGIFFFFLGMYSLIFNW